MEFRNLNTLFGHALKTGEPLISNSPATHPARGGLPPGHPPLHCFLGVPIKWANKLIGMVGVANRAGGYDQALVDELEPLFSAFGSIINDVRVSKERDAADERIMALNVDLRDRAERLDKANRELAGQAHLREQALENAVLRLRHLAAMDAASDGIALLDAEGLHTYTNKAHAGMFGFETAETLIGQSWKVLYDPPEWQRIEQKVFPELMERRHWHGRATARRCDGGSFLEDLTLTLTPEGTLIRVSRDVTAAAAVEQEIRTLNANLQTRAQELSRANRELSDFAHVVSHDLKAPLRGIGSLANWLQTDYAEQLGLEGTLQLRMLTGRVKRLAALIDGILSYSRAGRVDGSPPPVALDELVRSTIDLLAPPPDITITIETPLPRVTIDATRAQQLFQNLLSNAIKHRDKPGGRVAVRCAAEGGEWHFSVADNGPGIEAKYFERIFGLFQTLARRDDMEASGVGLAVVKKIVETERGRVWVESEYGRGATFHFTLPRCPQPPLEAPASPP
jgi:PAS domain S-box-containing protein